MGKGGDKQVENASSKVEVLIDGRLYDVTNFKHPGGSVIKFYSNNNIDASEAFYNFHLRSKKAKKVLQIIPSREADTKVLDDNKLPGQQSLLDDFHSLQKQLELEGYFKPNLPHTIYRISEIILMHALGFYLLFNNQVLLGIIILGIVSGRCGWLMHEGGHYSLTGLIPLDRLFQVVLYGVGCGMSGSWWRIQHNKHHSMPQKIGYDVDLNTLPLVCFTQKIIKRIGFPMKLWLRMQAPLFPIITTSLVALGWQFYLHPRHVIRTNQYPEGISLLARYAAIAYFISPKFGALNTLGPLKWVNWWMSYLNFQIEHHLFPSMPQFRHPLISKRIKALFEKHGLVYDQRSYFEAISVTFENLDKVGIDAFYG
eukprot:gene22858-29605_t